MEAPVQEPLSNIRAEAMAEPFSKLRCTYRPYECVQLALEGHKYCKKHILQDKNAPYRQCTYVYPSNGKRCPQPTPKSDKKEHSYCSEHGLKVMLTRCKEKAKGPPPNTPEAILNSLSHYIKTTGAQQDDKGLEPRVTRSNDPFVDIHPSNANSERSSESLDVYSESESDSEPTTMSMLWLDHEDNSSNEESNVSDTEDCLKHSNVYTADEVTTITKEKLIRLQSLYIEEYRHLQYRLKENRRKYMHALKREKETCCSIHNQVRDNPREQKFYKKLKALKNYHRDQGIAAILSKRLRDLRTKIAEGVTPKPSSSLKCTFSEGGVKCGEKVVPLSRFCMRHILEDHNQVLFKPCGKVNSDVECSTPIVGIFEDSTCPLHMEIPALKSYNQIRKDSESDADEAPEPTNYGKAASQEFPDAVKTEFMNYIPPEIPKMETVPSLLFEETISRCLGEVRQDDSSEEKFKGFGPIEEERGEGAGTIVEPPQKEEVPMDIVKEELSSISEGIKVEPDKEEGAAMEVDPGSISKEEVGSDNCSSNN